MNREILFRGKSITTGEMKYGYIEPYYAGGLCIIGIDTEKYLYQVDENTIGQYTGLTDKNGTKIFEGDIIQFKNGTEIGYVFYDDKILQYRIKIINNKYWKQTVFEAFDDFEVIGNIYDNADLLGEV